MKGECYGRLFCVVASDDGAFEGFSFGLIEIFVVEGAQLPVEHHVAHGAGQAEDAEGIDDLVARAEAVQEGQDTQYDGGQQQEQAVPFQRERAGGVVTYARAPAGVEADGPSLTSVAEVENQITGQNVGGEGKECHLPDVASPETADEVAHAIGRGLFPHVAVEQGAGEEEQEEDDYRPQIGALHVEFHFHAAGLRGRVRVELCSCFHNGMFLVVIFWLTLQR